MDYGNAGTIGVEHIISENLTEKINGWLVLNYDKDVLDIKLSSSATEGEWATDALIIYRK